MGKRILSLLLVAAIVVSFAACSSKKDDATTTASTTAQAVNKPADVFCVSYNDTVIYPDADFSTVSSGLGQAEEVNNIDNDGAGKVYTYDGMTVTTAIKSDKEIISKIELLKSTISTCEGVTVTMPPDMVEEQSKAEFTTSGSEMTYSDSNHSITMPFDESGVYSILIQSK